MTSENTYDLNNDGTATQDLFGESNCIINQTLTFKSDNTGTIEASTILVLFEGNVAGTFESDCTQVGAIVNDITWSQNGNSRTFTINGSNLTGTVSGTQLIFMSTDGLPIFNNAQDAIISTEGLQSVYDLQ